MPDMSLDTPKLVKNKRDTFGLTQKDFAELLGLNDTGERTVSGWERGEHTPTISKLKEINELTVKVPFKHSQKNNKFRFIDLFAGIGGLRLPFQELGGSCVFSSEWDRFAKKTYASNFGELPYGDITQISSKDVPDHDVLLAGFPCQAFSKAGLKNGFFDTRGTMFFEIQRILAAKQPKVFLLENVKQLKGHNKGETLDTILKILRGENINAIPEDIPMSEEARKSLKAKLNYIVDYRVLSSNNFGVPQRRERIYLVGFNKKYFSGGETTRHIYEIFSSLEKRRSITCLGNILEKNLEVPEKYTISNKLLEGHERRKKQHKERGNGFGYSVFNTKSQYCNTISARYYKDGSEILIDQSEIGKNPRKLTPRECARIQGYPDNFIVDAVSDNQIYKQFGNSVSVPVIKEIASKIIDIYLYSSKDTHSNVNSMDETSFFSRFGKVFSSIFKRS